MFGRWSLVLALVCACGANAEPAAPHAQTPGADDPATPPAANAHAPVDAPALPDAAMTEVYDFVAHPARAEVRTGDTLFADLGTAAGAKYTNGGFRTQLGEDQLLGGATTTLVPGVTGQVVLPVEGVGAQDLRLRARAFADGHLTLYVNDAVVGRAQLSSDEFRTIHVTIPAGALPRGENYLRVRVPSVGSVPGGGRASLALDWFSLGPATPTPDPPPAAADGASDDAPTLPVLGIARDGLHLPAGMTLSYAAEVPAHARLRARVVGASASRLALRALSDGSPARALVEVAATAEGAPVDVDLASLAGQVVRFDLVATGPVTLTSAGLYVPAPERVAQRPPAPKNVLVYLIDTLRADRLRPYAPDTTVRTPGFDAYARQASLFVSGHAQENWTKPSVATLLSGLFPWQHGATTGDAVVPNSVHLLSEGLHDQGFFTGAFICNGYVSGMFGFRRGWSTWRNYIKEGRRTQARFVAADVLEWLDHRPAEQPFFLYVHTIDPHVPYLPPDDLLHTYDADPYDGPVNFNRDRELLEKVKVGRVTLNDRDRRHLEALYDAEITYHDVHMAAILDGLERRGVADDTLVIVTADHGEEFYDHGSVGHGHTLYEELLHVPLVMRWPGLEGGPRRIDTPAGLVDVLPTIYDVLGQPRPEGLPGQSLVPLLRGDLPHAPPVDVSGFLEGWRAALSGHHKLIQRAASNLALYDLEADPGEQHDLAADRPLTVRWLRGMLGLMLHGEDARARDAAAPEHTRIDAETEAQLRALGYVGTSAP